MGDTERLLCPGAPQSPAGFQGQRVPLMSYRLGGLAGRENTQGSGFVEN